MAIFNVIVVLLVSASLSHAHEGFDNFLKVHEKVLPSNCGEEELLQHYQVWKNNLQYIEEHNSMESTFKLGINEFTHLVRLLNN